MTMAPELPANLEWLNLDQAPTLAQLRGKVVLLLFWSYSNNHSMRLLPTLRQLQQDHDPAVAVIAIHCPKFNHERDTDNVLKAINRNFVRFPVACDRSFEAWNLFGIEAWPSVTVIDASGQLRETIRGDDSGEALDKAVTTCIHEASSADLLDASPLRDLRPTATNEPGGFLRFPTSVIEARGMLYVSDTSNNRIVEIDKDGRVQRIFGSGNPGLWDGASTHSGFKLPRGLAYAENFLYVADTGNHAIRRVNLFSGEVETVVGNGKPELVMTSSTRRTMELGLPLPLGLAFNGPDLYISVSGAGQIWRLDMGNGTLGWFSGTGQHGVVDGEPVQAAFAQPAGLAAGRQFVYVADADGSAVRELRHQTGHVGTRCGQNPFVFGREDGTAATALLQYPMGVALRERSGELWVADSFNDCIRLLDLGTGVLSTPKLDYQLSEPADLSIAGNTLWIANTNAHEIVRYDLVTHKVEPLSIAVAA